MTSFSRFAQSALLLLGCCAFAPNLSAQFCNGSYYVRFPDDRIVTACDGSGQFGMPTFLEKDSVLIAASFQDDTFFIVPDACYKIERTWRIIDWCTYDPACALTRVPNPNPNPIVNHASNLPGPVVSDRCEAPVGDPWRSTRTKIGPTDTLVTNFCTFWQQKLNCGDSARFNGYLYTQTIKILDGQPPKPTCTAPDGCDLTDNDPDFWNSNDWWDPKYQSHDLNEMPIDLKLTATDLCSGANVQFRCLLFLDLDQNGTAETVVDSRQAQQPNTVFYGNALLPNYQGGEPRAFDQRIVADPSQDYYRFALQVTRSGANATAALRFVNQRNPNEYRLIQLPHGQHKIKWIVEDNCGNETVCEQAFTVKDCLKPVINCKTLSVNIMQPGLVTLFTSDLLESASDNGTPFNLLELAISKWEPAPTTFPTDPATGLPIVQTSFTCADIGTNLVQLWAKDIAGNAAFCQTTLSVKDDLNICSIKAEIEGYVKTVTGKPIADVSILQGSFHPAFPPISVETNAEGFFKLSNAIPIASIGNLCPAFAGNPVNGVTALDLILIGKHILGLKSLPYPYKTLAADVNKSGTITTFDVVELRKLILGIYDELPNNTSWRFFEKPIDSPFPPSESALKPCVSLNTPSIGIDTLQFLGIKIGDVNDTALPNMVMDSVTRTVYLDTEDQMFETGDDLEVVLTESDIIAGQQFTLEHPKLEFIGLQSSMSDIGLSNFGIPLQEQLLTHVWSWVELGGKRPSFTLRFKATGSGTLSEQLRLSNKVTYTEAYSPLDPITCAAERLKIALRFNTVSSQEPEKPSDRRFALLQNQPNPFYDATTIGFYLPEAGPVTLNIVDVSGKQLLLQSGVFAQGYQQFFIDPAQLPKQGLFYYTVGTKGQFFTKIMTRI